ncbi:MAG: pentapeptide repeat-containing protein [Nostoc sp. DedQUE04]|uniref:nSTAND1 domain-containing NTPase n=1 Tax=Nostoc sp. DedQUE04 TaxID=3075390 RepID=UPI002AD3015F|nr:pentapeptide repeat-containing protein [Nostoc sp. DedQUE04]MDZ8140014.1 pentapeptide repeat-containing protein [Nostoc sp. DedQUE04]
MKKLVILQFDGEFSKGYKVTLEVGEEGKRPDLRIRGELPQALEIIQCFQSWRDIYRSLDGQTRIKKLGARNVNIDDLKQKCDERSQSLLNSFNSWLQSQSFNPIKNCLYQQDWDREDEIRVILSTDCQELRKLPWHLWNGFYAIPYFRITPFEVALSAPDGERRERPFREKIRILIILGDSTEINVKADEQLLQKYCGDAEIVTLVEPLRQQLNNYLQDEIGWDMLFFSGHSQTQGTQGRIFLNHHDSLTMAELRDTLLPAIAKRLQLAIFNSCDGLGIALELESLQIPQVIVMREPVPDKVAQEFLKHFLKSFTGGSSLCISVGYARQQLQRLESQFPCASWLPVIVQNQLEVPPTWQSLGITRSPYRGLMAFREEDAENFFGREAFVEQLVIDVTSKPLVAVIGASGSGKSSVVFAGLIPQLRQNNIVGDNGGSDCDRSMGSSLQEHRQWQIISFRPGKNPFESLAIALEEFRGIAAELLTSSDAQILQRRQELELEIDLKRDISGLQKIIADILHTLSPTHLLLVIDQFEEVYTLCPNAQERQIFIDSLLNAVNHTPWFTLLITLRADFLGKAMSYQPLGKALQDYPPSLLAPMSRKELERAIIQPAARFSVELEEGLVNKLIDDVGSGEGSLPLQQFALTQLWGKQRPGLLTHQAYTEIGGVTQALKNHADVVYAGLSETQQKRAQRLFIQLVQPGEGTEDTRRLATRDEVGDYWDLVTLLANERLLVTNRNQLVEDTVEVVHEALIRNWGRLRGWMDDNREGIKQKLKIEAAAKEWVENKKRRDYLLRGTALKNAKIFIKNQKGNISLSSNAQIFIQESIRQGKFSILRLMLSSVFIGPLTLMLLFILLLLVYALASSIISSTSEAQKNALIEKNIQTLKATQGQNSNPKRIEAIIYLAREKHDFSKYVFAGENLSFINFDGLQMKDVQFQRSDLRKSTFLDATLSRTNFSSAKMKDTQLERANLVRANLSNTNLVDADLTQANLTKAILRESNLSGANVTCANLIDADLTNANLQNAKINHIIYSNQTKFPNNYQDILSSSNVNKYLIAPNSNLRNAKLQNSNLTNAKLANTDLRNSDLREANLTNADLRNANLSEANLRNTNLTNADLRNVDLRNVDLREANLTNAKLREANLTNVDLTNTNLDNADLTNTNLTNADLMKTNFVSTKNLTFQQLKLAANSKYANYDENLKKTFPDSFKKELYSISGTSFDIPRTSSSFFKETRLECQTNLREN